MDDQTTRTAREWPSFDDPRPAAPLRVLFVMQSVEDDDLAFQIARLARLLPSPAFRLAILSCKGTAAPETEDLSVCGVDVDVSGHLMDFDQTIHHVARSVSRHDVIVGCQNVADLYPALDRLSLVPPVVEWGQREDEAAAGPMHHTQLYIAQTPETWRVAALRMPRADAAILIPPLTGRQGDRDRAFRFQAALTSLAGKTRPAPPPSVFASFWQGGFECSTHRRRDGQRLDVLAETAHDRNAAQDYLQLQSLGLRTVRDGVRWHLVEPSPGQFDFSSVTPMVQAARACGTQVIWDLMHYGWPDDLDIWSPQFADRFARFAAAVARHVREVTDEVPFWCPVNEISFMAWGGGDVGYLNPFALGRGFEMKVQLARAAIAAMGELRGVDGRARFVHCEPAIAIHYDRLGQHSQTSVEDLNESQFQAFDLISGRIWPQIGGCPEFLDICGVNYYHNNQWFHGAGHLEIGDPGYRPLSDLLHHIHARYGRPVAITETGIEGPRRPSWLNYVAHEALVARARGVPVEALCLYPVADHAGWDDDRHCPNGLVGRIPQDSGRVVDGPLAATLAGLQRRHPELSRRVLDGAMAGSSRRAALAPRR